MNARTEQTVLGRKATKKFSMNLSKTSQKKAPITIRLRRKKRPQIVFAPSAKYTRTFSGCEVVSYQSSYNVITIFQKVFVRNEPNAHVVLLHRQYDDVQKHHTILFHTTPYHTVPYHTTNERRLGTTPRKTCKNINKNTKLLVMPGGVTAHIWYIHTTVVTIRTYTHAGRIRICPPTKSPYPTPGKIQHTATTNSARHGAGAGQALPTASDGTRSQQRVRE